MINIINKYGLHAYEEGLNRAKNEIGNFSSPYLEKSFGVKYGSSIIMIGLFAFGALIALILFG